MRSLCIPLLFLMLVFSGCAKKTAPEPISVQLPSHTVNYLLEIKPILDKRCVVCHSCYNSPCQLKLSSYEGVDRGGSKKSVYRATRLTTMNPTRLFIDAKTTEEWRQKDFHTVTESSVSDGLNNSLMLQILDHKMKNPESTGEYHSEANDLTCSATSIELDGYLSKHPNRGMPFGFPPLKQQEFELIAGWLAQGARGPTETEQQELTTPKDADAAEIVKWETFFNNAAPKYAMTARYLYEHLFLAHIKFGTETNEYYELLRSTTPPGTPVELINTVRPYDDPGTETFYYRFRKIYSTIVHKTHMVFDFDDAKLARFKELFIEPDWLQQPHLVGYDPIESANPFGIFEQIPPRSRYQFLLDNSHYILTTFIRGPVCRGQIALNVIQDHFWVMFQDPDHDLSIQYPAFLKQQKDNLIMPIEKGSSFSVIDLIGNKYDKALWRYYNARQDYYMTHNFNGQGYDAIWKGNQASDSPILTIYRHFDSASVHKGVLGDLPRTMWVMDYPQLERIYYALVAGFDVYGTVGHQLAVRLYMDGLREEGESYFLGFMPEEQRRPMMESWYKGVKPTDVTYYDAGIPGKIEYKTDTPKREFIEEVVNNCILPEVGISFDKINYLQAGHEFPSLPDQYETMADYLQAFQSISKPGTDFFTLIDDFNANVVYIRIRKNDGTDAVVSMVINRWHDNVQFMFDEKGSLDPSKDNADFLVGFYGSYPNYFMDIHQDELPDFFDLLKNLSKLSDEEASKRFAKYGINRANKQFWEHYDWFQERFYKDQPVQAGLFDLNRYYYEAKAAADSVDFQLR
ncbi:MAG: fatty acid cis/trans isomerase [Desulfocapsa sp.]|uniref:Fatty acid cis/trans isomerase n=1 Tax=Desulfotalea psychrophila TaxID=84980 RepID=A0ABS3AVU9_9BACT|nr:fatty acid cis/trans isomerase [Desulfocapsa sp.]MBN4068655.1 fatty acid cis/trans isomerase [Desulfotalea psychrophila]